MRIDLLWLRQGGQGSRCRQSVSCGQSCLHNFQRAQQGAELIAQRGATLIELIVFIIIISVAVAGIMAVLNISVRHSADPLIRKQMLAIAESLMDEVQLQPFTFCDPAKDIAKTAANAAACGGVANEPNNGPPGGNANRSQYNNVMNYNGISLNYDRATNKVADPATAIADMSELGVVGQAASPPGYGATIDIATDADLGPAGSKLDQDEVLRITVTVASAFSDETIVLEGYRTRWAPNLDL